MKKNIRIGTRGSKLALWQANHIKAEIENRYPGTTVALEIIKTTGDIILDVPLAQVGGKGLFVKEIEEALLDKRVDLAVHSMKDVPTVFPENLHLACITKREDPRDALISKGIKLKDLKEGAVIGTSSLRRSSQLLKLRPDFKIAGLRGNLDTRIRKLEEGEFDGIILAKAGLKRLGWEEKIAEAIPVEISLPAIGQGALGIECRIDDKEINETIAFLNDEETSICVSAERAFLKELEGGCQVPIGAFGELLEDTVKLTGLVASIDGETILKDSLSGKASDFERIGTTLAKIILDRGGREILAEIYGK